MKPSGCGYSVYFLDMSFLLLQMHGRYRNELGEFARSVAASQREREIKEMRRKSLARQQQRERKASEQFLKG